MKTTCKVLINGMSNPLEFLKSDVSPIKQGFMQVLEHSEYYDVIM